MPAKFSFQPSSEEHQSCCLCSLSPDGISQCNNTSTGCNSFFKLIPVGPPGPQEYSISCDTIIKAQENCSSSPSSCLRVTSTTGAFLQDGIYSAPCECVNLGNGNYSEQVFYESSATTAFFNLEGYLVVNFSGISTFKTICTCVDSEGEPTCESSEASSNFSINFLVGIQALCCSSEPGCGSLERVSLIHSKMDEIIFFAPLGDSGSYVGECLSNKTCSTPSITCQEAQILPDAQFQIEVIFIDKNGKTIATKNFSPEILLCPASNPVIVGCNCFGIGGATGEAFLTAAATIIIGVECQ